MLNAVIYARYSAGPRQTDQSIEGQLRVCHAFAAQHDLTIIEEYCDRHISGRTDDRPEFQRMIADAKKRKFQALVVYKTDRLARDKYDSVIYKRELKKAGVQIYYAAEAIPDGPEGIILESLMEGLAEYYSAELSQKIKRGMHESAHKCQSTGSHRPLGYKTGADKRYELDPASAEAVRAIFDMYVRGTSSADICEYLNSHGFRTVRGQEFNKNSIPRIIKNRSYIGEYSYDGIVAPGGMPRIITDDTFELAQAELAKRTGSRQAAAPRAQYLLSGKLFCGKCLAPMQGVSGTGRSGKRFYYYYCANTRGKEKTCDKEKVPKAAVEEAVVSLACDHILQDGVLQDLVKKLIEYQVQHDNTKSQVDLYRKKLQDNKNAQANILKLIEAGSVSMALARRLEALEAEAQVIADTIETLDKAKPAFTEDQILFMLEKYMEPAPGESEEMYRKRIISCFVSEVYLYDDGLRILFNITGDDGELEAMHASIKAAQGSGVFDVRSIGSTNAIACRTPGVMLLVFGLSVILVAEYSFK